MKTLVIVVPDNGDEGKAFEAALAAVREITSVYRAYITRPNTAEAGW